MQRFIFEACLKIAMFNLRPFSKKDSFELHKGVVNSKKDASLVERLSKLDAKIKSQFILRDSNSVTNSLEKTTPLDLSEDAKVDLVSLYNPRSKLIGEIKREVTTGEGNRAISECQYCTINSVSSMDHIMSKSYFPEFSVNAHNLFPCCLECNNHKSNVWLREGKRQFLNLYLDVLPTIRYLFVELVHSEDVIVTKFYLENRGDIDNDVFQLIFSHYKNLNLCDRFSSASNSVITSLKSTLISLPKRLNAQEVRSFIELTTRRDMEYFGPNYWKSVLQLALIENADFLNSCGIED